MRLGGDPADISAVFVTHEHSDHIAGVFKFARKYSVPVWASDGTLRACVDRTGVELQVCSHGYLVQIEQLNVLPFEVPHDAAQPLQYTFSSGDSKLGVLTDVGHITSTIVSNLNGCDALFLETNHDEELLRYSRYPKFLRDRIAGDYGHLSNRQSVELLQRVDKTRLKQVVGAHLSRENNTGELAAKALRENYEQGEITIATQEAGTSWISLGQTC